MNHTFLMTHNENLHLILQDLYDSEINFSLTCFWDGGFDACLGDLHNGFITHDTFKGDDRNISQIILWLRDQALINYPDSEFAKKYSPITKSSTAELLSGHNIGPDALTQFCIDCGATREEILDEVAPRQCPMPGTRSTQL